MAFEHKDGSGSLFKNTKKEKEAHPDYRGELKIGGTLYELGAWVKDGNSGKFFSISAKPKMPTQDKRAPAINDDDDTLPF